MNVLLRLAADSDRSFLFDLHRAAYEPLAVRLFGVCDKGIKRSVLEADLLRGPFRIIEVDGRAVGAIRSTEAEGHVVLEDLMVLPQFQSRGIGSSVLGLEIARVAAEGKPLRLHTSVLNEAQAFYRRHGFVEVGRDERYVDFERSPGTGGG